MKTISLLSIVIGLSLLMASCSDPASDLKNAQQLNTIESYRSFIGKHESNTIIREKALNELTNQSIIAMIAIEDGNLYIRKKALEKITDQISLAKVIMKSQDAEIIDSAWVRLQDQEILKNLADTVTAAGVRIRAIYKILDDNFLLKRSRLDISDAIRMAAVEQIKLDKILTEVALNSYYSGLRNSARMRVTNADLIKKIIAAESIINQKLKDIRYESDQGKLAETAIKGEFDQLCIAAVHNLKDQQALASVAAYSKDRNVAKIAFTELNDPKGLEKVLTNASDNAIKIAASVKLRQKSLDDYFSEATSRGKTSKELGDLLAAVSILPDQQNINDLVTDACLTLIRRGDESRIPELVELLNTYGDVTLTEDYLNCGQPDLNDAGRTWAYNHGYDITSGYGSNRARWGSGN